MAEDAPITIDLLPIFETLALQAGRFILAVRARGTEVVRKEDDSPVTEADRGAETLILNGLAKHLPAIPVIAEEAMAAGREPDISGGRFMLVDPLDGTKEFIRGGTDFTVNIALIENGVPVAGVVHAPALDQIWSGDRSGASAAAISADGAIIERRPIRCRPLADPPVIVASRSHRTEETERFLARFPDAGTSAVGSSLKFCLVAEGKADLYPRFGRTMEWDTAAGDAVLRAAGGESRTANGGLLSYGKRERAEDSAYANGWFLAGPAGHGVTMDLDG